MGLPRRGRLLRSCRLVVSTAASTTTRAEGAAPLSSGVRLLGRSMPLLRSPVALTRNIVSEWCTSPMNIDAYAASENKQQAEVPPQPRLMLLMEKLPLVLSTVMMNWSYALGLRRRAMRDVRRALQLTADRLSLSAPSEAPRAATVSSSFESWRAARATNL